MPDAPATAAEFSDALETFRARHPEVEAVEVFVTDLNGLARGKLMPASALDKIGAGGLRMPVSTLGLDIFGADVPENGIAIERGDPDGPLVPVPATLAAMPWARGRGQLQCMLAEPDGTVAAYDPRGVLDRVAARAAGMGLAPVMALELEFFLVDPGEAAPPRDPATGARLARAQIYDMEVMGKFEPVLAEIRRAAEAIGAPAEGAICEFGPGQFEMNLRHVADPLAAADHMIGLKRAIRGVARRHGLDASFMPKPYGEEAGSGPHVHLSLLDREGRNVFAGDGPGPNEALGAALAGLIATMPESMLIFSPHLNGYRRFAPGSYAPLTAAWGLDNRGVALRVPETRGMAARLEHRVAGSDANPYLLAAAVLAGALAGLEAGEAPPPPLGTEAGPEDGAALPLDRLTAERAFAGSAFAADWLGRAFRDVFAGLKRQERATMMTRVSDVEHEAYLRIV